MEKNADLAKAINAINTRDDKAKFLLYDTIDDPVVQSFYDMLAEEEEEASPEDSQTENRLTYISRDHPQVYSYRNMRCDGAQLRDAILNNDTKQFWFSVCLRCLGQRRDLPPDHDRTNCRGICFFCLSYAHVGEPCPGPLRRCIDHVRQVIALEGPGLEWYERMARPQTPPRDLAPVMEAREHKVVQVAEEREVISLLSSSPSSNGKGQGDVGDESKLAARDEDFIHRPQPLDRDTETFHNDAGYQEHGVLPLPSHGGREWTTEEMVAYYANQRDMAAYVTDSEDEDAYQEDDYGQGSHESEAHPYYPGPHWMDNNDVGQQALGTPSHLPPLSSPFGVEQDVAASVEWDPVVYPGSQEDCAIDLTSDGPGSPQTVIYFDEQRGYAENEYDGGFEAEDYYGETDMEEDEEVGYLVDEDDDGTEMDEDEEYDVKQDADMNEGNSGSADVVDLTSSSPPPESNLQQQAIEPQPTLHDAQSTSDTDQDLLEGTRSQTPTDACDDLPAAARDNQEGLHASDIPSSDTVMANSPGMFELPAQSHLGTIARDSLSPLRRRASRPSAMLENIATSDAGQAEPAEQDTFASARDSMTLYSGMSRSQSCTDPTAISHSPGDFLEQNTTRASGPQNNQDTSQPRSDLQEPSSSPHEAPPSHTSPDHARDYNQHVVSDVGIRENTPLSGTDLIQLQLEVERQRAMRVDSFNDPGFSASLHDEEMGSGGLEDGGPMGDVDAIQPELMVGEDDDDERGSDSGSEASASDMSSPGGVPLVEYEPNKFEEQQLSHNKTGEDHDHIYCRGASWRSSSVEGRSQASDASANDNNAEDEYDAEDPGMDVEVDNDEDDEMEEEDERFPGGDFEGQTPPPPSPTPTELAEHQQAIDFAQAYLHHPPSISTISTIADSDEAEEPDMDAKVYNDEGDETEEGDEHLPGGDLLAAPPPPSPSPTPTELAEHQQAIDFAQAHLRPPSSTIADSDSDSDEGATAEPSDEDEDPSCPRFLPCGPPAAAGQQAGSQTSWEIDPAQKPVLQHHRASSAPPRCHEVEPGRQKQRGGEARARTRSRSPPRGEASVYRLR
ncbi:hypothetical protein HDK77DRAFT_501470 [Phyllosticta capitalensis]